MNRAPAAMVVATLGSRAWWSPPAWGDLLEKAFRLELPEASRAASRRRRSSLRAVCSGGRGRGVHLCALTGEHRRLHAADRQVLYGVDQVGEVPAEPVELPQRSHGSAARPSRTGSSRDRANRRAATARRSVAPAARPDRRSLQPAPAIEKAPGHLRQGPARAG